MKHTLKKYQIWIGSYHLGQGSVASTKPEMVAEIEATNFKVACVLHELKEMLKSIEEEMKENGYVDEQSCRWFYNFETNSNSWTGTYYKTKEEAEKSFKINKKKENKNESNN
jgi:effector-binding domain-containing protein